MARTGEADEALLVVQLLNPRYDPATRTATYDARLLATYQQTGVEFAETTPAGFAEPQAYGASNLFIDDCPDIYFCYVPFMSVGYVGLIPGGPVGQCWDASRVGCFPCNEDLDYYAGLCNDAFPECGGDCYVL